jgi:hypothetical protein
MPIADGEILKNTLQKVIQDYNLRPHASLKGLTPTEVYNNQHLDLRVDLYATHKLRIQHNKDFLYYI